MTISHPKTFINIDQTRARAKKLVHGIFGIFVVLLFATSVSLSTYQNTCLFVITTSSQVISEQATTY